MSRTDAHRPYHVWLLDHPELRVELHDHVAGPCDLPEVPSLLPDAPGQRCFFSLDPFVRTCGCDLCHGGSLNKRHRRSIRTRERLLVQSALRGASQEDLEELESELFVPSPW